MPLSTDVNRKVYITNYRPSFTKTLISVFTVLKSSYNDTGLYVCEEGKREIKRFKVDVISPYGKLIFLITLYPTTITNTTTTTTDTNIP